MFNKNQNLPFLIFILLNIFTVTICANSTSITKESLEYDGTLGIGWGVFAIIIAIIIGILCCIFGIATLFPGVFILIGFALPIIVFLFFAFTPLHQPGNLDLKNNLNKNIYVVVRWLFFTVMLVGFLGMFVPLFILWGNMLIPQRVDSRAQREYYEKYEKLLEEEKHKLEKDKELKRLQNENNNNGNIQGVNNIENNPENGEILLPVRANPGGSINNVDDGNYQGNENDNLNPNRKKRNLIGLRRRKEPGIDDKIE